MYARLTIEYDGTGLHGWARQPGHPTVEGAIWDACDRLNLGVVRTSCAGRTDAGVHAAAQVVALDIEGYLPPRSLMHALNQKLPPSIVVYEAEECPLPFDARGQAVSRTYEYRVLPRATRSPLRAARVLHHPRRLDLDLLRRAAELTLGRHDFTAFTRTRTEHTFFHRTVLESRWEERADEYVYCVTANAFLRNMVRVLVGSMLAIGRGEFELDDYEALLAGGSRSSAAETAAPQGLCFMRAVYPEDASGAGMPALCDSASE